MINHAKVTKTVMEFQMSLMCKTISELQRKFELYTGKLTGAVPGVLIGCALKPYGRLRRLLGGDGGFLWAR